ncbi:MAG: CoA transferase, partial [Pseudomonadota bacterium]
MSNPGADVQAAYAGLNVLDVSARLAGAFAARWFGDFGADVILAEPETGHTLRHEPPFSKAGDSALHTYVNWNKRSIAFDQLENLAGLVEQADLVITTDLQTAAALEGWLHPTAVLLCCTAHGARGELAARPGNNLTTSARTG